MPHPPTPSPLDHRPPHTSGWGFPSPAPEDFEEVFDSTQSAYLAWASLDGGPPEQRVLAALLLTVFAEVKQLRRELAEQS